MTVELERGAFCISIDLELAWGVWDRPTPAAMDAAVRLERPIVRRLLELFDRYETPVTWAIVASLFDAEAETPAGPREAWFAPELVDAIRGARTSHEVGSHSHSHVYYSELSAEAAASDLQRAVEVHSREGLECRSFVYPRNMLAHEALLRPSGIAVYRSRDAGWLGGLSQSPLRRAANLADKALPLAPPVVRPELRADGLVELASSLLFLGRNGVRGWVPPAAMRRKLDLGLRRAASERLVFHLWFHPSNFYADAETQFALLEHALAGAAAAREAGQLEVLPMGAFAA